MSWAPKNKIVVPVDFSGESESAIRTALEMVEDPANVQLIHVLFPLDVISPGVVWGEVSEESREEAVKESFGKFLSEWNISGVSVNICFGDPGLEIAEFAEKINADLIVIPSHGYHGMKRFTLGSVAERVIRHANCSVLVLRRSDAD